MRNKIVVTKNKGYKFRLVDLFPEQLEYINKNFGCARKIYNEYVASLYEELENIKFESGYLPKIKFKTPAAIKKDFLYMKEVDSLALCNAQLNFEKAIRKYNKDHAIKKQYTKRALKRSKTLGIEPGFRDLKGMPSFKSKKEGCFSFTTNNQIKPNGAPTINVKEDTVAIPKLKTPLKFVKHRELPQDAIIKSATISKDSREKYYISFTLEYEAEIELIDLTSKDLEILGLDYAQKDFYVDSNGEKANYPKFYRKMERKLIKEQRALSKKVMHSKRWWKQKKKVSSISEKIVNQRKDWIHKLTYNIVNRYDVVVVEDLDLRNLAQCLSLGKNLHDNGFGIFRNYLEYKLEDRGKVFLKTHKSFPSSKKCSSCGNVKSELGLDERVYVCEICNTSICRDTNAAINLVIEGKKIIEEINITVTETT